MISHPLLLTPPGSPRNRAPSVAARGAHSAPLAAPRPPACFASGGGAAKQSLCFFYYFYSPPAPPAKQVSSYIYVYIYNETFLIYFPLACAAAPPLLAKQAGRPPRSKSCCPLLPAQQVSFVQYISIYWM
nr:hypothetical protein [Morchella crassipes]